MRFNLINPKTNNHIRMKTVDAGTGEELSRGNLVGGFANAKDGYVLLDKEDFEIAEKTVAQQSVSSTPQTSPIATRARCAPSSRKRRRANR